MTKSTLFALVALTIFAPGCKKKVAAPLPPAAPVFASKEAVPATVVQQMVTNFSRVHFEVDQSSLNSASKAALDDNAKILKQYGQITIEVQGHADERGTTDYNVALGDRRAKAVQGHLRTLGVAAERVNTVSYGEERPAASGHNETAWSQNRRAEFRILTGPAEVTGTTR